MKYFIVQQIPLSLPNFDDRFRMLMIEQEFLSRFSTMPAVSKFLFESIGHKK